MTLRKISKEQPEKFEFSEENLNEANKIINKYPWQAHCNFLQ